MFSQGFIKQMEARLKEEKLLTEEKIANLKKPIVVKDNPDIGDLSQAATEDILHEQLLSLHNSILDKINDALERIQNGTYGKCLACGTEISEEALKKEPWAEHCSDCLKILG